MKYNFKLLIVFLSISSFVYSGSITPKRRNILRSKENVSGYNLDHKMTDSVSDLRSSYKYYGAGLGPLPVPALTQSIGVRKMLNEGNFAIDSGFTLATLVRFNAIRGYLNGLLYAKPEPSSQYYIGLGGSFGAFIGIDRFIDGVFLAPNLLAGKEFINNEGEKRFFQVEALYPVHEMIYKSTFTFMPLLTLKYGMAF